MQSWKRCCYDRRLGGDRRRVHSLDYFAAGGGERRGGARQRKRKGGERRKNWCRVGLYTSVYYGWPATFEEIDGPDQEALGTDLADSDSAPAGY